LDSESGYHKNRHTKLPGEQYKSVNLVYVFLLTKYRYGFEANPEPAGNQIIIVLIFSMDKNIHEHNFISECATSEYLQ